MFLAEAAAKVGEKAEIFGMSDKFWIVMIVMLLFVTAIWTSSYNDDKTKGL